MRRLLFVLVIILMIPDGVGALTISEGLREVASRSPEIMMAEAEHEVAGAETEIVRGNIMPHLRFYAHNLWLNERPEAVFGPAGAVPIADRVSLTYGFEVKQLLFDFRRTPLLVEASQGLELADRARLAEVRQEVMLEFLLAYYDALEAESIVKLHEQEVKRFEAHLKDTEALYEAGLITRNDLLQAEVLLADAKQRRITAENLYEISLSNLNRLLRRDLGEPVTLEDGHDPVVPLPTLSEAERQAELKRPILEALRSVVDSKRAEINAIKAELYPRVFLKAGYEYQENPYMVHESNWSLVGGIEFVPFAGGQRLARLKKAEAELKRLKEEQKRTTDLVILDVRKTYLDYRASVEKLEVTEKAVAQAEENLRLQKLRYKEGVGTATEVTDAVTLLSLAETNRARALYEKRRAIARFLRSLGEDLLSFYATGGER